MLEDKEHNSHPDWSGKVQAIADLPGELLIPSRYDDLKGISNLSHPWAADEGMPVSRTLLQARQGRKTPPGA